MKTVDRFMSFVMPEPNSGCWLWTGATSSFGYGFFGLDGRKQLAHRVSWMLHHGAMPDRRTNVCHRCDVSACVNPDHLWLGTFQENNADKVRKGRQVLPPRRVGGANANARLSDDDVRAILRSRDRGRSIAKRYGVAESTIGMIRTGRNWPHLFSEWISIDATRRAEMKL
jgi:hypothetical protein